MNLFSRLYIEYQNRDGNREELFQHENQACPLALSNSRGIRYGANSDLLAYLEDVSQPRSEAPATSCIVLHGTVIVQMLKPAIAKTFDEYAQEVFMPFSKLLNKT